MRQHNPSGRWRATLPPKLDPSRKTYYFGTRDEAQSWLDAEISRRSTSAAPLSGGTLLIVYLRHYLNQQSVSADWSPRSLASMVTYAEYLKPLHDRPISTITRGDLQTAIARLLDGSTRSYTHPNGATYTRSKPLTPGSIHNVVGLWKRAFRSAVYDELIARSPAERLVLPPLSVRRAASWTPAEARRIAPKIAGHRLAAVLSLIFGAGLRISEARGLAWADVDWEHQRAWIWQQADGPRILQRVKGRVGKWVPLLPPVLSILRRQQRAQTWTAVYVSEWRSDVRVSRDTIVSDLKALAQSVGARPLPPHAGRHAVGNVLGAAGIPLSVIADRLRHESRSTTADWYVQSEVEGEAAADRVLADLFSGADVPVAVTPVVTGDALPDRETG